jgi:DNA-binding transcriptional MerR regulator
MRTRVTIGDFSRASHLSVKTLRHYHEIGLLEPSRLTGYPSARRRFSGRGCG